MARYGDGQEARLGDVVRIEADCSGIVVCDIDSGQGTAADPIDQWSYLGRGVMIRFDRYGLVHYEDDIEADVVLVTRASSSP